MDTEPEPEPIPIVLSDSDLESLRKLEIHEQADISNVRRLPPGRVPRKGLDDGLTPQEIASLKATHIRHWEKIWGTVKTPQSQVKLARKAWAWNLRRMKPKTDEFIRELLNDFDFFLCRYILTLVENDGERINWASLSLTNAEAVIYRLWPTESYKSSFSASVTVNAKIGLTNTLEIIELPVGAGVDVVWQGNWKWASAIIRAWGVGDTTAGWRLERDISAPFAGDRELYLLLQVPRGKQPAFATALLETEINTGILNRSYKYVSDSNQPFQIEYYVA